MDAASFWSDSKVFLPSSLICFLLHLIISEQIEDDPLHLHHHTFTFFAVFVSTKLNQTPHLHMLMLEGHFIITSHLFVRIIISLLPDQISSLINLHTLLLLSHTLTIQSLINFYDKTWSKFFFWPLEYYIYFNLFF